jgi:DinB superfamily
LIEQAKAIILPKISPIALALGLGHLLLQRIMQNNLLNSLETELRNVLEIVRNQIANQPDEALQARRDLNALECFAHQNAFLEMYIPRVERAIHLSKARRWKPAEQVKYTMVGKRATNRARLSNPIPRKTPKRYDFAHQPMGKEVIKTFLINSERLLRNIQAAQEVDINKAKIGWGPSGFFKLTLGNILEYLVLHGQRHVHQAQNALR